MTDTSLESGHVVTLSAQDAHQAALLWEDIQHLRLHEKFGVQQAQTGLSIRTTAQIHVQAMEAEEAFYQKVDAWVNTPGRTPERQKEVEGKATFYRDSFDKALAANVAIGSQNTGTLASREPILPERPREPPPPPAPPPPAPPEDSPPLIIDAAGGFFIGAYLLAVIVLLNGHLFLAILMGSALFWLFLRLSGDQRR